MAKKKKKTALAAALEKAAKASKTTATKAAVTTATKKVTSAARSAAVNTAAKQAEEAARKAAEQAKKKAAAQKTQENVLKNTKAVQEKQKSQITPKKRGAVVLSDRTKARKEAANKLGESLKKTTTVSAAKKAIEKSQKKSALGTEIKRKTETVKVDKDEAKKTKGHAKVKAYTYEDMTSEDYNRLATATQQGRLNEMLKSDKKLAKKVTDLNVKDYAKSPVAMGVLDQMTQGLSVSQNPVYDYSDAQKEIIESQKKTGKYTAGRVAGAVGEFALGGTGTLGSSLAKTSGKAVLKEAAEQGGKALAKRTAKNVAKETAADTLVSAPLNTLDALKASYKDGKFDKKEFAKELALNVGGDILIGGVVSGITHGLSAKQVSNFNRINKALNDGKTVSESEMKFYNKHIGDFAEKVDIATEKANGITEEAKVTAIKNPYSGRTPVQRRKKTQSVNMGVNDVAVARNVIELANGDKSTIKKAYQKSFDEQGGARVQTIKDVSYKDEPYQVSIGKKVVGKVVSDKNMSAEKLAVLDNLDEIIAEGKFIGSGEYIPHGKKKKLTERFDYFETDVNISGKNYVVSFDVEVFPNVNNYRTHQITKIDLSEVPDADVGPVPTAKETTTSPDNKISENSTNVKSVDAKWKAISEEAYNNPGKVYNNAKEKIFDENPSPKESVEKAKQRISQDEVPQAKQTAVKFTNEVDDDVAEIIEPWMRDGYFDKKVLQTQEQAREQAKKELADGRLYQNFMESKVEADEHLFMARAEALLSDLMKKAPESDDAAMQLLEVMDKATEASSHAGRLLNATKLLLRNTPEGRKRMFIKEVERLSNKFSDRLKGKPIELTEEQLKRIGKATDENIEEVAEQINLEIWEQIPATWFEKWNELRHTSMLFNAKTHARNLLGNSVFYTGRLISDGIEIAAYKIPAVKKHLESMGGKTQMVHVSRKEITDNKKALDEIFDANYKKSNSKNRYNESTRPDGVPVVKNKFLNKIIQTNYGLLEKEDLLAFKPEYRKNFIRWCKANDVDLSDISKMSKEQMQKADAFAIRQAELATFRDDSAFARKIVGLKNKTATKKGKTVIGTAGYRAANVALESNLPFVKTPVNILRRSMDYSPIGLLRSSIELMTAKTADDFMQGVHHMATGLTGTGIFGLGMWLANRDFITVKAGEESGDAYYDRDMGYQDYSLLINIGDKQTSWTIDWLSPMQTSLFMGATAWNNISDGELTLADAFDGLTAITGPMLDMSFMSSSKDTIETFMEKVYRNGTGEDADWSGAIMQTLFGSIPQGYLNSFVPQVVSQTATAFDKKQRDTRSTLEDPVAASWDSFAKKLANRIPVLRNKVLNPKLDRFGNDIETGNNIVTRMLQAYINPSTVKTINTTKLDKEIIKIYNSLEDGSDDKKFFYYNFTGNPNYDLGNGKRMTYDEAYKYGKAKRIEQTQMIRDMVKSKSYDNMTMKMKADEVNDAHWISQTHADRKTYGNKFALKRIIKDGGTVDSRAAKLSKSMGVSAKDYMDFYLTKEKLIARSHDSDYNTKALAVALSGLDTMASLYDINIDKVKTAKEYLEKGGNAKEYSNASCNIISAIEKAEATVSTANKALAAAEYKINERTYTALGIDDQKANMGAGLKKFGYDFDKLLAMKTQVKYGGFDTNQNGSISKAELVAYIDSLGVDSNEEKACLFEYLKGSSAKNPYGSVPNYLNFKNTTTSSGGSIYSKSKTKKTTETTSKKKLPSWENYVKDYITNVETTSGVNFKDWDSPLDKTYQNKIDSILNKMEV